MAVPSASPSSASASIGCDYVIAGHVYETGSKDGLSPLGLHGLRSIVAASPVPVLAIGGISAERVADVFAAGVTSGIAVMSGIGSVEDPQAAARGISLGCR
ncbi:MAG: thiamine phosphate synthase [Thermomicrobiales bacterium]